jgi:hypothetical protein
VLFAFLYARPVRLLVCDWWNNPEAGHGLLLAPHGALLRVEGGHRRAPPAQPVLGGALIVGGVLFRYVADLAAELFTMRGSMLHGGRRPHGLVLRLPQVTPLVAAVHAARLSIPLPELVLSRVALPLQFTASQIGAGLLAWRDIPVRLRATSSRSRGTSCSSPRRAAGCARSPHC